MKEHPKTSSLLRNYLLEDDNKLAAKIPAATARYFIKNNTPLDNHLLITRNLNIYKSQKIQTKKISAPLLFYNTRIM